MSATSDAWPIYTPGSQSKPGDAILSRIARHGTYNVADAAELPTLLAAIAAAGQPAPSAAMPVTARLADTNSVVCNTGSGWAAVSTLGAYRSYTPTPSCSVGSLSNATAAVRWAQHGRTVNVNAKATITDAGAGSGALLLPLPVNAADDTYGVGRETQTTGVALTAHAVGSMLEILRYDNESIIASGRVVVIGITYEAVS